LNIDTHAGGGKNAILMQSYLLLEFVLPNQHSMSVHKQKSIELFRLPVEEYTNPKSKIKTVVLLE